MYQQRCRVFLSDTRNDIKQREEVSGLTPSLPPPLSHYRTLSEKIAIKVKSGENIQWLKT